MFPIHNKQELRERVIKEFDEKFGHSQRCIESQYNDGCICDYKDFKSFLLSTLSTLTAREEALLSFLAGETKKRKKHYRTMYSQESKGFEREDFAAGYNEALVDLRSLLATLRENNQTKT